MDITHEITQEVDSIDECSIESDYHMISDIFNFSEIMNSNNFGIKRYKNFIYKGQIDKKGQRSGYGIQINNNERIYEGQWDKDKRNGEGYEQFGNGNCYKGQYKNNKPHGKGFYTWANGETYDGEWQMGSKNGNGIWQGLNCDRYIGHWKDNKTHG